MFTFYFLLLERCFFFAFTLMHVVFVLVSHMRFYFCCENLEKIFLEKKSENFKAKIAFEFPTYFSSLGQWQIEIIQTAGTAYIM